MYPASDAVVPSRDRDEDDGGPPRGAHKRSLREPGSQHPDALCRAMTWRSVLVPGVPHPALALAVLFGSLLTEGVVPP
ncbi:hypothetical protein SAMN02799631_06807, partial [Methylobacterium sp. 174MFSha1.1]